MSNSKPTHDGPIIACHGLAKRYHDAGNTVTVLDQLELEVHRGELIAIIGSSGCGKTTLLQLLAGLDKPSQGEVRVAGHDVQALGEAARSAWRNRHLGFIFQFHHLLPEFSVLENVSLPLYLRGMAKRDANPRAIALLEQVGLAHYQAHRIGALSGGERQRVAIARALVTQPDCVLADEPTGNLDQANADIIYELMQQLHASLGISFVIVTHNESLAQRMQRIYQLTQGSYSWWAIGCKVFLRFFP